MLQLNDTVEPCSTVVLLGTEVSAVAVGRSETLAVSSENAGL